MSLTAKMICLIACHGGPADHFATFAEQLTQEGYEVQVYAAGPAIKRFQDRNIPIAFSFKVDGLQDEVELAVEIAKSCSHASVALTDVGHPFDISLQKALAREAPHVLRLAYYDNPEPYVPGGYSSVAVGVMKEAQRVCFANANFETESLYQEPGIKFEMSDRVGIGYYPIDQADRLAKRRLEDDDVMRAQLFSKHGLDDHGQKVLVYFGGNNQEYFEEAFPAFLDFLSEADLSDFVIVMQQHPGAKAKNSDREQLEKWMGDHGSTVIISDRASDEMQVIADGALYYQTSMGPLMALAGIPMIQVAHVTYEDILVRNGLCRSVTNASDFMDAIQGIKSGVVLEDEREIIFKGLGIRKNWLSLLEDAMIGS